MNLIHRLLCAASIGALALSGCASDGTANTADSSANTSDTMQVPRTKAPLSRSEQKRAFLRSVNESISGAMITGNRYKYVGKNVDLHCSVDSIPDPGFFNATCGTDADGDPVTLVIVADSKQLSPGQAVRVIGTVVDPMEGSNAMGGEMTFPAVRAKFME